MKREKFHIRLRLSMSGSMHRLKLIGRGFRTVHCILFRIKKPRERASHQLNIDLDIKFVPDFSLKYDKNNH